MTKRKKIVLGSIVILCLGFFGYHYARYLKASSRMPILSADLDKRIAEFDKQDYPRAPLFGPSVPGNAAEIYKKVFLENQKSKMDKIAGQQLSDAVEAPDKPIPPELKAALETYLPAFETFKQGANAKKYKPLKNWINNEPWNISATGLGTLRLLSKLAVVRSRELAKDNNAPEALKLCLAFIRAGDDMARRGTLIEGLVGIYVSAVSQKELARLLNRTELPEMELAGLIDALQALLDSEASFNRMIHGEQLVAVSALKHLAETNGLWPRSKVDWNLKMVTRAEVMDAYDEVIPVMEKLKSADSLPYAQAIEELNRFNEPEKLFKNQVSQLIVPGIGSLYSKLHILNAQRRGLYILTALKLYKAKYQKYPDKLADLAPDIIKTVPLDPFSGQAFIYNVLPDGAIQLYSIGANLKDDNCNADKETDIVITPLKKQ
ncbi:MAG TPA: hypothetical protein VJC37_09270 [Planctomycetota bacterium]|nr:hypothetical protein [Planctomycetota bacterium]